MSILQDFPVRVSKSFTDKCFVSFLRNLVVNVSFETFLSATNDKTNGTFYSFSKDEVFVKYAPFL